MIQVWYANHIERLAGRLIENLAADDDPRARLFAMPPIVVPDASIEAYLRFQVAREAGIASGLVFRPIETLLETLLPRGYPPTRLLDRDQLRAFFLDVLDEDSPASSLPEPVQRYLDAAEENVDARNLRRFQLATRLAQLARQYGDLRPEVLRAWSEPTTPNSEVEVVVAPETEAEAEPAREDDVWQRALWARLVRPDGPIDLPWTRNEARWVLPYELYAILGAEAPASIPSELHVFGFAYPWPGMKELLQALSPSATIHVYALTPSAPFLRDLELTRAGGKAAKKKGDRNAQDLWGRELVHEQDPGVPQIVRQWGKPGRDFFTLLNQVDVANFRPGLALATKTTVLSRIQNEILTQQVPADKPANPDDSLLILACPGIRRELEVIANEIWRLIGEDDRRGIAPTERLKFRDMAVAFADTRNESVYQAHLRAAFEEMHSIPYAMTELPLSGECRIVEALQSLLALPFGTFTRPEMLKILTHPALQARFPEADTTRWADWCEALAIVHGGDESDHADTYIDRDLFHWEQGLKRLVLGAFMSGPRGSETEVFTLGTSEYVPHDEPTEALADSARLLALVRSLIADARFLREARLSYADWATALSRMAATYFAADSTAEQRAFSLCLGEIHALRKFDVPGRLVPYRFVYETLRESIGELKGSRGQYLAEGVVVSSLAALRGLPFRVLFICGMGEGRFPTSEGPDPLDVSSGQPLGAVNPRERDKFLFLEAISSTRDRLYLTYVSRDSQTGEPLEPSPVIHELLGHLDRGRSSEPARVWIKGHPLRRYAEEYFSGGRPKPTFLNVARSARNEARARQLRDAYLQFVGKDPRLPVEALRHLDPRLVHWLGLCPLESASGRTGLPDKISLSLREIRRFLECPLQGWARLMLRLREDDREDLTAKEDEHFSTQTFAETGLLRDVFFDLLNHRLDRVDLKAILKAYEPRAEALLRQGQTPVGIFREVEQRRHLACLMEWQRSALNRGLAERLPFEIYRFGRAGEHEQVSRLERPIILNVPVRRGQGKGEEATVRVELHGSTEMVSRRWPGSLTLLTRDNVAERDFLGGFLDAVVLSLLPDRGRPTEHHAHVIPTPDLGNPAATQRTFRPIDEAKARGFLSDVVADLIGGTHAYLLPVEAVFAALSDKAIPVAASVEQMKEDDRAPCRSRYGPVPNIAMYEPPPEDEAARLIERRFGLFRDSGGLDK